MTEPVKTNSEGLSEFQVKKPSAGKWILYIILFITLNLGIFRFSGLWQLSLVMTIISIIVVPLLWSKITMKIMRKNIIENVKEWKTHQKLKPGAKIFNALLNFSLNPAKMYFLERQAKHVDLNSVKEIYANRIWDFISSCIGLTFLIALGLKYIIAAYIPNGTWIMGISLILLNLSPILVSWLVPIFWTMKDVDLRSIDQERNVNNIGVEMRKGIFSKFLGFTGILTGIGFFTDLGDVYWNNVNIQGTVQIYIQSAIYLFLFIVCITGTITFITVRYLASYHFRIVNECRNMLKDILELGETQVKVIESSKESINSESKE